MRLIDADALIDTFENIKSKQVRLQDVLFLDGAMAVIDNAPTIDAVPIIRCKD